MKNGDEGERKLNTIGGVTGKREVEVMVMVAEEDEDARRREEKRNRTHGFFFLRHLC